MNEGGFTNVENILREWKSLGVILTQKSDHYYSYVVLQNSAPKTKCIRIILNNSEYSVDTPENDTEKFSDVFCKQVLEAGYKKYASDGKYAGMLEVVKKSIEKLSEEKLEVGLSEEIIKNYIKVDIDFSRIQLYLYGTEHGDWEKKKTENKNNALFDVVLVHKMDRLARNIRDTKNIQHTLQENGIRVIFVAEQFEDNASGHLLGNISASIAEFYSENLGTEVIKGMKERAYKGLHTGGIPPLGYDVDITSKKLIINEAEAQAVRRIFELYNKHVSLTQIADTLNSEGYTTKNGNKFTKNSLHDIIRNKKYCGYYVYNRRAPEIAGKGNSHKDKDKDDIVEAKGAVPEIITEEDCNKAMTIMNGRKAKSGANSAKRCYLLSGHVKCGHCGCNMTGDAHHNGKKKSAYR